ncbi:urease accessory protein UreF [Kribbella sp. CA-245084]|uniref:urease accessory protein UreF n=1 Tax=Kribbella sp. CA-245084 TaxID=3239940 RepID=UPI003D8AC736
MGTAELVALMLADGRLPTGGHTQSAGLEPAVRAGLGADGKQLADVATYARDRLRTVARVDAAVAVVTRHVVLAAARHPEPPSRVDWSGSGSPSREAWSRNHDRQSRLDEDGGDLDPRVGGGEVGVVERAWAARTSSQAVRGAVRRQGRLLLRLAGRVWPGVGEHLPADGEIARPIVMGVVAAVTGLSAEQLARVVAYDDAQTVVSASLKLLPVDPAEAATWLAALHDDIEELVADVAPLTDVDKIPANAAPLIDIHAQNHVTERMRLFHA